ncbi:MAG: LamG-like jellyroll fold domain-containing protein [Alphaproteobacteria bacterium]
MAGTYTLELELFSLLNASTSNFEIWADGALLGGYSSTVSSAGSTISISVPYGGLLPSSLEFRFNDAAPGSVDTIEIRSVKINDRYVNTNNYLSGTTLNDGGSQTVSIGSNDYLFDASEPTAADFLPATQTYTAGNDFYRNFSGSTDQVFDMLGGRDTAILGSGNDRVAGGAGDDVLYGYGGNDLLYGGADNDRLFGGDGNDTLYGGDGNDRIHGEAGDDEIHGGLGDDRLNGHEGNDIITGGDGADKISGGDDDDYLFGDAGDDQITGGNGNDTLDGGSGADLMYGGSGVDHMNGGDDNDIMIGDAGNDVMHGDAGDDTMLGLADNDTMYGGAGLDEIYGGAGNDTIDGGTDADTLYGGIGDDTLSGGAGNDIIYGDLGNVEIVMQASRVSVSQTSGAQWHSVNFDGIIKDAVVKMFFENGEGDFYTARVRNITNTGFEFQIDEYDYLDGVTGLETLSWIAVASGTHTLSNGSVIQAGHVNATDETATSVSFNSAFSSAPVVFTQVSSYNESDAVLTRNYSVTTTGFNTKMDEQESKPVGHATEDIGWIAIESGGSVGSGILAGTTGDVVTHGATAVSFGSAFAGTPVFVADMQTNDGSDPAVAMGIGGLNALGTSVFVREEQSNDAETNHTSENVGYIALESGSYTTAGKINGSDVIRGGDGDDTIYADLSEDLMVADTSILYLLAQDIISDNPVGYWQLNETSGTVFDNVGSVGSNIDATSTGGPTLGVNALYAAGGLAVDFDGVNDGIHVPDDAAINTGTYTEKTVELVFNADDVTTRQVLYEEGGSTHGFSIYVDGGNVYVTGEQDAVWVDADIHAAVSTGTTYHVAFVFDSVANSFEGFLDGVSMGSVTVGSSTFPSHGGDIGIGYAPDSLQFHDGESGSGGYYFDGRISDVAIYTTALTQAQLQGHSDIVHGTLPAVTPTDDDVLYGGDGLDTFYGGEGRDVYVFESASAFNDVDVIYAFDVGENDAIDISDLLTGYTAGVSDINDFVQITESGGNTLIGIDANGTVGGASFTDIVSIQNTLGMTADAMLINKSLIA